MSREAVKSREAPPQETLVVVQAEAGMQVNGANLKLRAEKPEWQPVLKMDRVMECPYLGPKGWSWVTRQVDLFPDPGLEIYETPWSNVPYKHVQVNAVTSNLEGSAAVCLVSLHNEETLELQDVDAFMQALQDRFEDLQQLSVQRPTSTPYSRASSQWQSTSKIFIA
ncbi:hypothetical protein E2320_002381 [Naja naja]|nr:hypothetical protein E2320_002381 [Naja naja]